MLKINILYKTNIKISNSKTLLNKLYKKILFFKLIYFYNFFLIKKIKNYIIKNKFNLLSNRIVVIKSPFHYKNSKSVLNYKKQLFNVQIILYKKTQPLFLNNNILFFFEELNTHSNFKIKKIKINHNVKF